MTAKRMIAWATTTICLFAATNGASYFLRSDGYGVGDIQDGIVRIGFPLIMIERGGFSYHESTSLPAAMVNLLVASITAAVALASYVAIRGDRIERSGRCRACGYDLTGNISGICPECGTKLAKSAELAQ